MSDKKVTDEESRLFREAISGTRRLKREQRVQHAPSRPSTRPMQHIRDETQVIEDMFADPLDPADLETGEELLYVREGLHHKTLRKLRRGELSIAAELDLHGRTKLEARRDISEFLAQSKAAGNRCVRIIHGKGHGSHQKRPVLKQYVNHWLRQRNDVLAFCSARPVDGGTGAIYLLLRNSR